MDNFLYFARNNKIAALAAALLLLLVLGVLFPQLLTPHSPVAMDIAGKLAPPSAAHWLGTDAFGRDVFARILYGGRFTLVIGVGVVALAFVVGVAFGTLSGFFGGVVDAVIMRCVDAMLSFPALVMAIAIAATFGPSLENAMLAVAITLAPSFARVARSQALSISARPYMEAALAIGVPTPRILVRYVLRNGIGPLLVQASLSIGSAILQTASLGFLGLGAQPPLAEWGVDLAGNLQYLDSSPWVALLPGLAILLTVWSFNLIGDALVDWLMPRKRNAR